MEIILWRHAEADNNYNNDLNRELTENGREQAQITADWLKKHLPDDYVLVCSEALRAKQTAEALGKPEIHRVFNPNASATTVQRALDDLLKQHEKTLVLVGHQPFLGQVASLYKRGDSMSQPVKKSGVYWIKSRSGVWHYKAITAPKLLK